MANSDPSGDHWGAPTLPRISNNFRSLPPITGAEASRNGTATVVFDVTNDGAGNITSGTATFSVTLGGFPANTPINIAHRHTGGAGVAGAVVFSTSLSAGEVTLANGSGNFTKAGIAGDPALMQQIINNPGSFYFNAGGRLRPGLSPAAAAQQLSTLVWRFPEV